MKNTLVHFSFLTSLVLAVPVLVYAEETVTIPSFEGGVSASIGAWYAVASSDVTQQPDSGLEEPPVPNANFNGDYDFAWQASIGYIFEETANGIDLFYRGIHNESSETLYVNPPGDETVIPDDVTVTYELNSFDLMLSQFVNLGDFMQMRFLGGLAYVDLERKDHVQSYGPTSDDFVGDSKSKFQGLGPRISLDSRYGFDEALEGLGIVGGGSLAYYIGELKYNSVAHAGVHPENRVYDKDNHSVINLRANLGLDYVYFFEDEEESTLGLELGYQMDFYDEAGAQNPSISTNAASISFSGPYLNLKSVF
ncbi:MAG: Lpg1974 family pore-forming outer membrane protein [Gammaproteobacteria bacterium]|jgi:hypothetical protein